MGTFDYFVGDLCCPACGHIGRGASTNMQTKLPNHPTLGEIAAGDSIDADWSDVCSAGYLKISEPKEPDTVTILEIWDCPNCGKPLNWATVRIVDGKIESVEAVDLSAAVVRAANYISVDCAFLVDAETSREMIIAALIERLENT